ncbi:amino acid adenylation domain-containing protein [Chitinophaga varians]|uniref:Amino acid adenylation domain-containing protein n=1 Tax=Chitinophaga varians TaxID=2202339 RepID=A0A847RY68_9BACT|nr:non-ribosomal peptide synthetase [Chitinophaga varians]NLR68043.1 amino acid adenylation domain-containing protein [Chitinophaga varians]
MSTGPTLDYKSLETNARARARSYWQQRFAGFQPAAYFIDYGKLHDSHVARQTATCTVTAPTEVTGRLQRIAVSDKARYIVLLAVLGILARKYSLSGDVMILCPVYSDAVLTGDDERIVPVRMNDFGDVSFQDFLLKLKDMLAADLQHSGYPVERILEQKRDILNEVATTGMMVRGIHSPESFGAHTPDLLFCFRGQQELELEVQYNAARMDAGFIQQLADRYFILLANCLGAAKAKVSEAEMTTAGEIYQIRCEFNDTRTSYPSDNTITALFEEQVRLAPENTAITAGEISVSYRRLHEMATVISGEVRRQGGGRGACVAVLADRSIEAVAAIIGILRAGAAYLPLDPEHPAGRHELMLKEAKVKTVLAQQHYAGWLPEDVAVCIIETLKAENDPDNESLPAGPDDTAYIMFTSGSTGIPKGVAVTHRNVIRLVKNTNYVTLNRQTHILQTGAPAFDATTFEIWGALLNGGRLFLPGKEVLMDTAKLGKALAEYNINTLWLTASLFDQHTGIDASIFKPLRYLLVGGDVLTPRYINQVRQQHPGLQVINGYGPTENTTFSACHLIQKDYLYNIPVGKPVSNSTAYILDIDGNLQAVGVPGELYVGGDGVAKGYLNDENQTRAKFMANLFVDGDRLYRTGDLARWLPGGIIEFLGRIDTQLKIRGFRVEPAEVKHHLLQHYAVRDAAVIAREDNKGKHLAAYYVPAEKTTSTALRDFLAERLPAYMLPMHYIALEYFPLTPNGKLDVAALPGPASRLTGDYIAPVTPEETLLAGIWEEVLEETQIGVEDNLFMLGADSIKALQISARVRSAGYEIGVKDIMACETIRELARRLIKRSLVSPQEAETGIVPLLPVQLHFFADATAEKQHFNQSVMLHFPDGLSVDMAREILSRIADHHDALRMVFRYKDGTVVQECRPPGQPLLVPETDLRNIAAPEALLLEECNKLQAGIDLENGPLIKPGLFHLKDGSRLLIVVHHLEIDGISWRILFEDIDRLYKQSINGKPPDFPLKTDSLKTWALHLREYARSKKFRKAARYWDEISRKPVDPLRRDFNRPPGLTGDSRTVSFTLNSRATADLLGNGQAWYNARVDEMLLGALLAAVRKQYGKQNILVDLEAHGREELTQGVNVSRTLGWFTAIYPVLLESAEDYLPAIVKDVRGLLRRVPNNGVDYLVRKYLAPGAPPTGQEARPQINFNYLGQFDADLAGRAYRIAAEPTGREISPKRTREYDWTISGMLINRRLELSLTYSTEQYAPLTIKTFMDHYRESLEELAR